MMSTSEPGTPGQLNMTRKPQARCPQRRSKREPQSIPSRRLRSELRRDPTAGALFLPGLEGAERTSFFNPSEGLRKAPSPISVSSRESIQSRISPSPIKSLSLLRSGCSSPGQKALLSMNSRFVSLNASSPSMEDVGLNPRSTSHPKLPPSKSCCSVTVLTDKIRKEGVEVELPPSSSVLEDPSTNFRNSDFKISLQPFVSFDTTSAPLRNVGSCKRDHPDTAAAVASAAKARTAALIASQLKRTQEQVPLLKRSESPVLRKRRSCSAFSDSRATGVAARSLGWSTNASSRRIFGEKNRCSSACYSYIGIAGPSSSSSVSTLSSRALGLQIMRRNASTRGDPGSQRHSSASASPINPSEEDLECAAIIRTAKNRVSEYNLRNPSPPPTDIDRSIPLLPTIKRPEYPDLRCISASTLCKLIDGSYRESISQMYIIDCRFDYEFEGGHIRDAIHIADPQEAISRFFRDPPIAPKLPVCLIFHCEFSKNRAPKM